MQCCISKQTVYRSVLLVPLVNKLTYDRTNASTFHCCTRVEVMTDDTVAHMKMTDGGSYMSN